MLSPNVKEEVAERELFPSKMTPKLEPVLLFEIESNSTIVKNKVSIGRLRRCC